MDSNNKIVISDDIKKMIPTENERLFETWIQLRSFLTEVENGYMANGKSPNESKQLAWSWFKKITDNPENTHKIMKEDWPNALKTLKYDNIANETAQILIKAGAPPKYAFNQATKYAEELRLIESKSNVTSWLSSSNQNYKIKELKQNMDKLVEEYNQANKGTIHQPLPIPDPYSLREIFNYCVDQLLLGNWFPFATYVAHKKGSIIIDSPSFDLSPKDFEQALMGNRMKKKILWNNVIKVVGYASLATLIVQGLIKIYKKYKSQQKEKTFEVKLFFSTQFMESVQNQNLIILNSYWDGIKELLEIDKTSKYESTPNKNKTHMIINNKVNIDQSNIKDWGDKFNELFENLTRNTIFYHKIKVYISGSDISYLGRLFKKNDLIPVIEITIDVDNRDNQDNQDNQNDDVTDNDQNSSPSTSPSTQKKKKQKKNKKRSKIQQTVS